MCDACSAAETSAGFDQEVNVPLYARFGLPEVWRVDLAAECIEVYRIPMSEGYQAVQRLQRGQRLSVQAFPDLELAVDDILG